MRTLIVIILFFLAVFIFGEYRQDQQQEPILEKVEVVNNGVPVRVFYKGNPVKGLSKVDFKLLVNGKEKEIQEAVEISQKITTGKPGAGTGVNRKLRFFLLLFNISDYRIDMKKAVTPFFDNILRPGDRIMLVSNSIALGERMVVDPELDRQRVDHVIDIEMAKNRSKFARLDMSIDTLYEEYQNQLIANGGDAKATDIAIQYFIDTYTLLLKEYKSDFMTMDDQQYIQLAQYLEKQDMQKWVLNFYQIGYFPRVKLFSSLDKQLSQSQNYLKLITQEGNVPDEIAEKDISKFFLNTGASFHTVLMGSRNRIISNPNFSYDPIAISSEGVFRRLTELTGSKIMRSNKTEKFFKELSTREDVYYELFYAPDAPDAPDAPGKPGARKKDKIEVKLNNGDYEVVYDNGARAASFQTLVEKIEKEIPQINLGAVQFKDGALHFPVQNYKMDLVDQVNCGKIRVRLSVFDEKESRFVLDRKKETEAKSESLDFKIALNQQLKPGNYKVFVEVTDLLTKKNDVGLTEMQITETI
ncbi:MAG: hypothetical protein QG657_3429 [Acidobacteriota bacterium]|nr:hypothetical protein [Acidobacteriota bacterium]